MRTSRNNILMFVGALAFFAVLAIGAPAALIAPTIKKAAPGISFQSIDGTIWHARINGVRADEMPIGNLQANIVLHQLLTGAVAYRVVVRGSAVNGSAIMSQSLFGRTEISNANFDIGRNLLRRYALLGVPVDGSAQISEGKLLIRDGACVEAEGSLQTDALSAVANQFGAGAMVMSGSLNCADGNLMAHLTGEQTQTGRATVELTQLDQFRYRMKVIVESDNDAVKQALQIAGFEISGNALSYEEIANWTDPPRAAPAPVQERPASDGA